MSHQANIGLTLMLLLLWLSAGEGISGDFSSILTSLKVGTFVDSQGINFPIGVEGQRFSQLPNLLPIHFPIRICSQLLSCHVADALTAGYALAPASRVIAFSTTAMHMPFPELPPFCGHATSPLNCGLCLNSSSCSRYTSKVTAASRAL